MDDTGHATEDDRRPGVSRRQFLGRAAGLTGAAIALMTLTACPGGDGDDDGDDDDGDDDD